MAVAPFPRGAPMLDLFFRKYAWTANLALLFVAAWLTAKTVNTLAGAAIRPEPRADVAAVPAAPPRPTLPATLDVDRLYKLIGQEPPREAEADVAQAPVSPQNCDDPSAAPAKSDLRLQLVVGVIAERARQSLATIVDLNTREAQVVGVGDEVGGARLLGLERVRADTDATGNGFRLVAIVCNKGTKEYLDFEGGSAVAASGVESTGNLGLAPVPPPARGAPGGRGMEGVRELGQNKYEIERGVIDSTLGNLNTIATQARIVPSFKNGAANGFKLFSIQPNSLYASIGIENGDVIQRVNGYEINSPDKALELYQKLRESQRVTIELERGGQVIRKEYTISGP
ncbi:type II secretion system protein GspC [Anaeromyxobacter terrae]|uniref:type II secretion system protein GspC n=1 Tax=Anaeromyxobacter terrae TaxID=2925406 RepID=UPI001F56A378|nr:type II secretion system protein GspC [Anaeromyxobacter sp. SG22]